MSRTTGLIYDDLWQKWDGVRNGVNPRKILLISTLVAALFSAATIFSFWELIIGLSFLFSVLVCWALPLGLMWEVKDRIEIGRLLPVSDTSIGRSLWFRQIA